MNKLARSITEWTKACDKRLSRLISYIHYKQNCHVGHTAKQCRLDCFKTPILQEILNTEVFAYASRSKAKAKPRRPTPTCSSTRTVPIPERTWIDIEPGAQSDQAHPVAKRLNTLLRFSVDFSNHRVPIDFRKTLGLRPTDQSCHHETWLHLDFVDWSNKWSNQDDYDGNIHLKERAAYYSYGTPKRLVSEVMSDHSLSS